MSKFKVGGVYKGSFWHHATIYYAVKVTRISASGKTMWFRLEHNTRYDSSTSQMVSVGDIKTKIHKDDDGEYASTKESLIIRAKKGFHCLHPFFPRENMTRPLTGPFFCYEDKENFHKATMLSLVLMFFSLKLVVLARRVKERMYAPGGSGFVAANENFERAAKRQCV